MPDDDKPNDQPTDELPETNMRVIAKIANMPHASVYSALRRRRSASIRQYRLIADALKLDIGTLLDLVDGGYWAEGYGGPRIGPLAREWAESIAEPVQKPTDAPQTSQTANPAIVEAPAGEKTQSNAD